MTDRPWIKRHRFEAETLMAIADLPIDDILDGLAAHDAQDADGAWSDGPASSERTNLGGAGGAPIVPARLLVFHPRFVDIGLRAAIDVIAWDHPDELFFQLTTDVKREVEDRYVLERVLETVRFMDDQGGPDADP